MIKKIFKGFLGICVAMAVFVAIYGFTVIANTPKIDPDNIYDYLSESSVLLDDEGNEIESIYLDSGNRTNIDYKDMPEDLVNAVVAIEDKTFWKHHGFNFWRMMGAVKNSIFSGDSISGTSTITQQLARNVYLSETKSVRSLARKISEAYYTVIIEKNMTKKEIMEAYLNTIYLGNNAYGIESAAKAYFNKDAKDLDLAECAALAALPKAPDSYALVKKKDASEGTTGLSKSQVVIYENADYIYYYNGDVSKNRRETTLKFMKEQGYITAKEQKAALKVNLAKRLDVSASGASSGTSYFVDYMIDELAEDLMDKYNYTKAEAREKIYSGGLTIQTTLNKKAQNAIEEEFAKSSNFPSVSNIRYDSNGNILNEGGSITLYKYGNYFNDNGDFVLNENEYKVKDGNIVLLKGKRLNFYKTTVNGTTDYSVEFKNLYQFKEGVFYSIEGGVINIPQKYKSLDNDGNLVIDKSFFDDESIKQKTPEFLKKSGSNYVVPKTCYTLRSSVRQPQAAMVITDYTNGQIKAMVGGRDVTGRKLYNRAINPRQPGSAIKPLSVYSAALQKGKEDYDDNNKKNFKNYSDGENVKYYGDYWTASSGINDKPINLNGTSWPKNFYSGYKGEMTMRKGIEQSVNTVAVRIFRQLGADYSLKQLKKFGITSVVEEGNTNDLNASALALGGMTKGISPLEMSAAFGTIPNKGVRVDSVSYTSVKDKKGDTILKSKSKETKVLDEGVAFITQDMLRTTVTNGLAGKAQVSGQTTGGKTGTTTDVMDIWFCGFTPQYSAAIWIGNDINIEINANSGLAASLWSKIMTKATSGMSGSLPSAPSNVTRKNGEYFISGTENGVTFNSSMSGEAKKKKEEAEKKKKEAEAKKKKEEAEKKKAEQEKAEQQQNQQQNNTDTNTDTNNNSNTDSGTDTNNSTNSDVIVPTASAYNIFRTHYKTTA